MLGIAFAAGPAAATDGLGHDAGAVTAFGDNRPGDGRPAAQGDAVEHVHLTAAPTAATVTAKGAGEVDSEGGTCPTTLARERDGAGNGVGIAARAAAPADTLPEDADRTATPRCNDAGIVNDDRPTIPGRPA